MAWPSLHDLMEQHTEQVGQALDKYKGRPVEASAPEQGARIRPAGILAGPSGRAGRQEEAARWMTS